MKCRKCNGSTAIADTRSSTGFDNFLVKRARLYIGDEIPFRVRRHKCKHCRHTFDTVEIEITNVNRLKNIAKESKS